MRGDGPNADPLAGQSMRGSAAGRNQRLRLRLLHKAAPDNADQCPDLRAEHPAEAHVALGQSCLTHVLELAPRKAYNALSDVARGLCNSLG